MQQACLSRLLGHKKWDKLPFSGGVVKIGGEGGIRTHVGQGPQQISSLRRYDRFEYLSGGAQAYVDSRPGTTREAQYRLYSMSHAKKTTGCIRTWRFPDSGTGNTAGPDGLYSARQQ